MKILITSGVAALTLLAGSAHAQTCWDGIEAGYSLMGLSADVSLTTTCASPDGAYALAVMFDPGQPTYEIGLFNTVDEFEMTDFGPAEYMLELHGEDEDTFVVLVRTRRFIRLVTAEYVYLTPVSGMLSVMTEEFVDPSSGELLYKIETVVPLTLCVDPLFILPEFERFKYFGYDLHRLRQFGWVEQWAEGSECRAAAACLAHAASDHELQRSLCITLSEAAYDEACMWGAVVGGGAGAGLGRIFGTAIIGAAGSAACPGVGTADGSQLGGQLGQYFGGAIGAGVGGFLGCNVAGEWQRERVLRRCLADADSQLLHALRECEINHPGCDLRNP